jgi:purine-nucleoside phosphorylase
VSVRAELDGALAALKAVFGEVKPRVGLILGSGLGAFADRLEQARKLPFERIPGFPPSTVVGHAGNLVHGQLGSPPKDGGAEGPVSAGLEVLAMQGRIHYYEGHDIQRVAFPARVLVAAGCRTLILTNAAGGVDPTLAPGQIVIMRDHINLLPASPLRGPNDDSLGPRFPDMSEVYTPALRQIARAAGEEVGLSLREGVYAALPGPSYETPAEVRMMRILGADLIGMSTVPEAIVARHMGARVLGLSCVTNLAAGISEHPLSHDEVTETAARVREPFVRLLERILQRISSEPA